MTHGHSHHQQIRRGCGLLVTVLAMWSLPPPAAGAAQTGRDYDCTDFDSRADAQDFYEELGGPLYDPFNLDDDEDGKACEEWAGDFARTAAGEDGVNGKDGIDKDCADFETPARAQRYFLEDGGSMKQNVDHLDANHNGVACEQGEPG